MFHDPIVAEVRAIREKLAAQFDFDIGKIVADAQRRQATSNAKIVSFQRPNRALPPTGPDPAVSDNSASQQADPATAL